MSYNHELCIFLSPLGQDGPSGPITYPLPLAVGWYGCHDPPRGKRRILSCSHSLAPPRNQPLVAEDGAVGEGVIVLSVLGRFLPRVLDELFNLTATLPVCPRDLGAVC